MIFNILQSFVNFIKASIFCCRDIIFLTDGSVYEVSYQSYETTLWLGYSSALLINGYQIINLDEGSEIIDVIKIK